VQSEADSEVYHRRVRLVDPDLGRLGMVIPYDRGDYDHGRFRLLLLFDVSGRVDLLPRI